MICSVTLQPLVHKGCEFGQDLWQAEVTTIWKSFWGSISSNLMISHHLPVSKHFTKVDMYFTRQHADLIEISLVSSKFYCIRHQLHHIDMYFISTTWVKWCWLFCERNFTQKNTVLRKKWNKSWIEAHNNFITASTL